MNRRQLLQSLASVLGAPLVLFNAPKPNPARIFPIDHLRELSRQLPRGVRFYEVYGQSIFPCYGVSGGLTSTSIAYLIEGNPEGVDMGTEERLHQCARARVRPIQIVFDDTEATLRRKVQMACEDFAICVARGPYPA